ncbi:flagellar biosynthesis protein FliQ [Brevibacillus humidisoli]|uniref:flagellar biosynthesis protein FliQ n=1 Tax=Brevibacillus humidisoli TaxID=2895522 RepID=UPI001E5CF545|nr:flagellar biosynthesis protein FliQ [Brevibacillus humidisoli]UFJ42139.1 flagellar biosynthesis protein FliQ [Brevibacillus humidisoli]
MTPELILQIAQRAIYTILVVLAPTLGIGLLVGLAVSIFQATTQIQEQTLAFIPKIVAILVALMIFGPWMLQLMVEFTMSIFDNLHRFAR